MKPFIWITLIHRKDTKTFKQKHFERFSLVTFSTKNVQISILRLSSGCGSLVSVQVFDIRRLNHGDVPVVGFDNPDAIDIEAHPEAITERCKDHLQVDIVAKDQPEPEHGLKEDDNVHEPDPRQHETADA